MSKLIRFGVAMDGQLLKKFDNVIKKKGYLNRSEAIRDLVRENIVSEEWKVSNKEALGTVTIVYNHETKELGDLLTDLQHHFHKSVISTLHVHLDEHNCLEVLVVKGKSNDIKKIADRIIATKGVKHGKLCMATSGKEFV